MYFYHAKRYIGVYCVQYVYGIYIARRQHRLIDRDKDREGQIREIDGGGVEASPIKDITDRKLLDCLLLEWEEPPGRIILYSTSPSGNVNGTLLSPVVFFIKIIALIVTKHTSKCCKKYFFLKGLSNSKCIIFL
jgi:hypothetical protein